MEGFEEDLAKLAKNYGIDYFEAIRELGGLAEAGTASLMLLGIDPTYPSEKYGLMRPASIGAREQYISSVSLFLFFRLPCNRCFCLPIVST